MKKCLLVMTDSDLVSKLYDDDELTGRYANPVLVADDIDNASFVGWEVQLPEIPTVGDHISLSPVTDSLINQWIFKVDNEDEAICYFLDILKQELQLSTYWRESSGEKVRVTEVIERIILGTDYIEGLSDGSMIVDKRFFVPDCDTVVLSVKHSL